MYGKLIEDMQNNMKYMLGGPLYESSIEQMNSLLDINKITVNKLAEQQSVLVKELLEDAIEQTKLLSAEKSLVAVVELQKSYLQGLQARFMDVAEASHEILAKNRDESTNAVKSAMEASS